MKVSIELDQWFGGSYTMIRVLSPEMKEKKQAELVNSLFLKCFLSLWRHDAVH